MGFIDTIKRWRLVQQGMSTGAKRRTQSNGIVAGAVDKSPFSRAILYALFTFLSILLVINDSSTGPCVNDPVKMALLTFLLSVIAITTFELWQEKAPKSRNIILVFGAIALSLSLTELIVWAPLGEKFPVNFKLLALPYLLPPMVITVLLGRNFGIFSVVIYSLFGSILIPKGYTLDFLIISLLAGLVTTFLTLNIRRRGSLLRAGFYAGLTILVLGILLQHLDFTVLHFSDFSSWKCLLINAFAAITCSIILAMIIGGFLPILESAFAITTNISWLELSDLNHKLLKRMQLEAPGTFHHSLVMASLAESAAESVDANASMCRVCAYFHDIGKLKKPEYFIENQGEVNPHDSLTPTMSSLVIIAHVKDGIDLAIKYKLNRRIIDVIQEHHGDSLVYYFYRKASEQKNNGKKEGEDKDFEEVDEKNFRYPGPTPSSKESGIISLADAIESASRTMSKPSPQKIKSLVDDIVKSRINDGQLDRCQLSLADLAKVKESFAKTLRSMLHNRIDYPKDNNTSK